MSVLVVGSREERLEKDWNHYKKKVLANLELLDTGIQFFITPEKITPSMERVIESLDYLHDYIEMFKISICCEAPLMKKIDVNLVRRDDDKNFIGYEYSNSYPEDSAFGLNKRVFVSILLEASKFINNEVEKIREEVEDNHEFIFDIARDFYKIIDDYLE